MKKIVYTRFVPGLYSGIKQGKWSTIFYDEHYKYSASDEFITLYCPSP